MRVVEAKEKRPLRVERKKKKKKISGGVSVDVEMGLTGYQG